MEVGGDRIKFTQIRALYDSERYPLSRRNRQRIDTESLWRDLAQVNVAMACHGRSCAAAWPQQKWKIAMLNFPNASRSYDATRRCIHFWGNDGALEVSFFLDESALIKIAIEPPSSEASLLESFDQNRERILRTARKVYERRRKGSYDLFASDFR